MSSSPTAGSTFATVRGKRDTRQFDARTIPADLVHRIVQAGRMAGSAKNGQPVRLVVLQDVENKRRLAACGSYTSLLPDAPLVVAIALKPTGSDVGELFDAGRAAQNMMIVAWSEGVSSCPNTLQQSEAAAHVLGFPEEFRVPMALIFGYPQPDAAHGGRPRLAFDEVVQMERYSEKDWGA
jgi:nitroreductase